MCEKLGMWLQPTVRQRDVVEGGYPWSDGVPHSQSSSLASLGKWKSPLVPEIGGRRAKKGADLHACSITTVAL